jgi:hypothetical protein
MMIRRIRPLLVVTVALAAVLLSRPALAGPPLLCFPFDIGSARSLPMGHGSWQATDANYDVSQLVPDTLALLAPDTPVMVRMETIRRATIYASAHPNVAIALLNEPQARAAAPQPAVAALAVFDFGYLVESYKEASFMFKAPVPGLDRINGYQLVLEAQALQNDAAMQHAAKLIADGKPTRSTK